MSILYWIIIAILLILAFVGLVYPVLPSSIFLLAAFLLYGFLFTFEPFGWMFWIIQILLFILIFVADHLANLFSVKKFGGSKAGIWGSTIGLVFGPFVIPFLGIILGPFIGAIIAELLFEKKPFKEAVKIGFGSVIGFLSSVVVKGLIMIVMVIYFLIVVL